MINSTNIQFFADLKRKSAIIVNQQKLFKARASYSKDISIRDFDQRHNSNDKKKEIDYDSLTNEGKLEIIQTKLKNEPEYRNPETIRIVMNLTMHILFFRDLRSKYNEELHYRCCKMMRLLKLSENQILFKQGDTGNHFYIILKGSVYIKSRIFDERTKEFSENLIAELNTGASFGELALIEHKKRAASVICKTDCTFAYLDKKDYESILGEYHRKDIEKKVNLIIKFQIFDHLQQKLAISLSFFFHEKIFKKGFIVYSENNQSNEIYFIKSGQLKILKKLNIENKNRPSTDIENMIKYGASPNLEFLQTFEIALVGKNEIIGEEEVVYNKKRLYTVICESMECEVFVLSKKDFLNRFVMDLMIMEKIKKSIEFKSNLMKNRITKIIKTLQKKQNISLRYDRNPKNFVNHNLNEKIHSLQHYYREREQANIRSAKLPNDSFSPKLKSPKLTKEIQSAHVKSKTNYTSPNHSAIIKNINNNKNKHKNDPIYKKKEELFIKEFNNNNNKIRSGSEKKKRTFLKKGKKCVDIFNWLKEKKNNNLNFSPEKKQEQTIQETYLIDKKIIFNKLKNKLIQRAKHLNSLSLLQIPKKSPKNKLKIINKSFY